MSAELLEVANLATRYPVRRLLAERAARRPRRWVRAVDGVSLTIAPGEMLALVGESGCGKTTTAQTILRMVDPSEGTIRFQGQDITSRSQRQLRSLRRGIQMIYQDPYESLDPRFRVRDTIEEPMLVHGIGASRAERRQLILAALERAELSPAELFADRYPHELSGGQRQRVAIAAALVLRPALLLADEPVSMLDVSVRAGVLALIDSLRRDGSLGILMITHDLSTAAHFADRIAVMYLGRVVEQGPARQVIRDPRHPYTRALLSVVPQRDPRHRAPAQILAGETPDPVDIPAGCRFRPRCPIAEDRCATIDPRLAPVADNLAGPLQQDDPALPGASAPASTVQQSDPALAGASAPADPLQKNDPASAGASAPADPLQKNDPASAGASAPADAVAPPASPESGRHLVACLLAATA